jgi:hypothetical protein
VVTALASLLYDIENGIIVDAKIEPLSVDERSLERERIKALADMGLDFWERKPTIISDRGHPSKDLIKRLQGKGIKHVMRVQRGFNSRMDKMRRESKTIGFSEGIQTRAIVFRLSGGGGGDALITNLGEVEDGGEL